MSLYLGNNLISGAMPNSANQSLSNLNSAGQDKFDAKVDLDLTNVNDTGYIKMAGMGMPSNKYINLTLGASGTRYTAPANGWYNIVRRVGANQDNERYLIGETSTGLRIVECSSSSWHELCLLIPVKKGDTVSIAYNATGEIMRCRFVYAQGSESEAQ